MTRPQYALVGCSECEWLWIVGTAADRVSCSRCGHTYPLDRLKQFAASDDRADVVAARTERLQRRAAR